MLKSQLLGPDSSDSPLAIDNVADGSSSSIKTFGKRRRVALRKLGLGSLMGTTIFLGL